jgi:hypothetical protein
MDCDYLYDAGAGAMLALGTGGGKVSLWGGDF